MWAVCRAGAQNARRTRQSSSRGGGATAALLVPIQQLHRVVPGLPMAQDVTSAARAMHSASSSQSFARNAVQAHVSAASRLPRLQGNGFSTSAAAAAKPAAAHEPSHMSEASSSPSWNDEEDMFITQQSQDTTKPFRLHGKFVSGYASRKPPFGFNGLGEMVYQTRYARVLPDGSKEQWHQTVERVVNGTYNMQKRWIMQHELGWDAKKAHASAKEMFDRIWNMKFMPPGRGLWAMGSPMTEERMMYAALNNCAFVSTEDLKKDPTKPFTFLMDAAMLGVGVGFDTDGAGTVLVKGVNASKPPIKFVVPDSREGWVESLRLLLEAHFKGASRPEFDYSIIRPRGTPIKGFGGNASGPDVLRRLHNDVEGTLAPLAGKQITVTAIVDIMNQIGRCVVSGDVRQTAEIAFGDPKSEEYLHLKDYAKNPHRMEHWGWTSNNSVFAKLGMDYEQVAHRVQDNGEPGFAWLENMRHFGRMGDPADDKDIRAKGGNPCLEQTLESYELCCLVETFPNNHTSYEDFAETLKYAYLYAKTVTLGRTHWPSTNRVMLRNRRIGCSMSGIAQFLADKGINTLKEWSEKGYHEIQACDIKYSDWLVIPRSIKTTCIKPSGTVSLLAGATPGMHYPESRFYWRRVRLGKDHECIEPLKAAGYLVEPAAEDPDRKVVVCFPVDAADGMHADPPDGADASSSASAGSGAVVAVDAIEQKKRKLRTLDHITMWEQLSLAAFLQRHWADNQVSCTITFDPVTEGPQIKHALEVFQYQLKGISFLPRRPTQQYKHLPYEAMSEEEYRAAVTKIKPLDFSNLTGDNATAPDKFCDSSRCELESARPSGSQAPETTGPEGAATSKRNPASSVRMTSRAATAAAGGAQEEDAAAFAHPSKQRARRSSTSAAALAAATHVQPPVPSEEAEDASEAARQDVSQQPGERGS